MSACAMMGQEADTGDKRRRFVNALGNMERFSKRFAKQFASVRFMIPTPGSDRGFRVAEQRRLREQVPWMVNHADLRSRRVPRGSREAEDQFKQASNHFGVRALQIALWHSGHYLGEVDGLWGSMSQMAMKRFLENREELTRSRRPWRGGVHRVRRHHAAKPKLMVTAYRERFFRVDVSGVLRSRVTRPAGPPVE